MLILLPPSEGKTPAPRTHAPVNLAELSFPELTTEREDVLEELMRVSAQEDALDVLGVGASLTAEIERNTRLVEEPAHPAAEVYTGVLFEALDYASFSPMNGRWPRSPFLFHLLYGVWCNLKIIFLRIGCLWEPSLAL